MESPNGNSNGRRRRLLPLTPPRSAWIAFAPCAWGVGVLLCPTNGYRLDQRFVLHDRPPIRIVTLDLNLDWPAIETDLR